MRQIVPLMLKRADSCKDVSEWCENSGGVRFYCLPYPSILWLWILYEVDCLYEYIPRCIVFSLVTRSLHYRLARKSVLLLSVLVREVLAWNASIFLQLGIPLC
jgi:hypothetical protein